MKLLINYVPVSFVEVLLRAPVQASMRIVAFLLAFAVFPMSAEAQLSVFEIPSDTRVNIDGMLTDWRGIETTEIGDGRDAALSFALAYNDDGLFFGGSVSDERLVRTADPGRREDAVVITLAVPNRRGTRSPISIWLYAGRSGRSAAVVKAGAPGSRPRAIRRAEIVEATEQDGYILEAFIPWRAIPNSRRWREAGAAVRLVDVDSEARPVVENEPATARFDRRAPERLPTWRPRNRESDALETFMAERGLRGERPKFDLRGNVTGDARDERVVIVSRFVLVMGPGYRDGSGFDFLELPVSSDASILSARVRDLTGDGVKELMVTMRQGNEQGARDVWQVLSFDGQSIRPVFAIETKKETRAGMIENRLRVRRGRPAIISVDRPTARGLSAETFREDPSTDAQPILLPWGRHSARTYQWNGSRFAMTRERENANYAPPAARTTTRTVSRAQPRQETNVTDDQRIAAARRDRQVGRRVRARFRTRVNLAQSAEPETLVVLGKAVLVVGAAFRGGSSFFYFELPVARAADLTKVETADLTGDGRHEILIYARQELGDITRTLLMVHRFTRNGFDRVATIEVAREQGRNRIENQVRVRRGTITVTPGRARGWSAETWPWNSSGEEGVAPLLLPWRDQATTFRWSGRALTR